MGFKNLDAGPRVPLAVRWYYTHLYVFPILGMLLGLIIASTFVENKLTSFEGNYFTGDTEWDGRKLLIAGEDGGGGRFRLIMTIIEFGTALQMDRRTLITSLPRPLRPIRPAPLLLVG